MDSHQEAISQATVFGRSFFPSGDKSCWCCFLELVYCLLALTGKNMTKTSFTGMSLLFLKTPAGSASDTEHLNISLELFCPLKMYSGSCWEVSQHAQ